MKRHAEQVKELVMFISHQNIVEKIVKMIHVKLITYPQSYL